MAATPAIRGNTGAGVSSYKKRHKFEFKSAYGSACEKKSAYGRKTNYCGTCDKIGTIPLSGVALQLCT